MGVIHPWEEGPKQMPVQKPYNVSTEIMRHNSAIDYSQSSLGLFVITFLQLDPEAISCNQKLQTNYRLSLVIRNNNTCHVP